MRKSWLRASHIGAGEVPGSQGQWKERLLEKSSFFSALRRMPYLCRSQWRDTKEAGAPLF